MTILPASDRSVLISFGDQISPQAHRAVSWLTHALSGVRGVLNLHPAFTSVLVDFDPRRLTHTELEKIIYELPDGREPVSEPGRLVEIPVEFGGEAGPDLAGVAEHANLTPERAVEIFCAAEYLVSFVGFSTCFPYLAGLPAELATPRLRAPRKRVPAGCVAIGGPQAGVYPLPSPGGWRLIGRTALALFDLQAVPPPLLHMDDRVRFLPL